MKRVFNQILSAALALTAFVSCWSEPEFDKDTARIDRRQVINLEAEPGDGEVYLTWALPKGWNPTEFVVSYTDAEKGKISLRTGSKETFYTVTGLKNLVSYIFNVQAVYGSVLSGAVSTSATPYSTRFPVTNLTAVGRSEKVTLYWTPPVSDKLTGYKVTYTSDGETVQTLEVPDKDATSCEVTGLKDDVTYTFTVIAKYANGDGDPASVKAMPVSAAAYILESDMTAVGLPLPFTFNRESYDTATDVKWIFPDGEETGDEVEHTFYEANPNTPVILSAQIDGKEKRWEIKINVREYVIYDNTLPCSGTNFNGFKGGAPMFSPDGKTIYNITFNKWTSVIAYDLLSGAKKWTYTVKHASYNGLTVNPVTGDIYFGTQTAGDFFALQADGKLKWQFKEAGSMQSASPAVSKDGSVVYLIDAAGKTFAINAETGTKIWETNLGGKGAGLLVNGNDLVVAVNKTANTITWLDTYTGEVIVKYNQGSAASDICGGFAVSPDKRYAYYGHAGGEVSKIDLQDRKIVIDCKKVSKASERNNIWGLVTAPNGDVFCPSKDASCYLLDPETLEVKATFDSEMGINAFNYARACSDTEGNFYITSGQSQNWNFVLGPDMTVKSKFQVEGGANKQMGGNNYLNGILYASYIGASGSNGHFIGKYVGGERYMAYGFDICGSCCIQ